MQLISKVLQGEACAISYLNLSHNRIKPTGALMLAEGVQRNSSLMELVLDGNPVDKEGYRALVLACLQEDPSLEGSRTALLVSDGELPDPSQAKDVRSSKINVSLQGCHGGLISMSLFNPMEPSGDYDLDM